VPAPQALLVAVLLLCSCIEACAEDKRPAPLIDPGAALQKLPAPLRERFDSTAGRAELARALGDKELLIAEARQRGLHRSDDVVRQVSELEDRLAIQALLRQERAGLTASDDELRAFYDSKKAELAQPERVQVRRLFVAVRGDAGSDTARQKANALAARLAKGEAFATLVKESDGPERVRGGELGAVAVDDDDRGLAAAAFALLPGKTSAVVATRGGFSILVCDGRLPARTPPFEEARAEIENRFQPTLERRAFELLLKKLRAAQGGGP
jgi:parvulin-like peptidyl-prolyl isomerase